MTKTNFVADWRPFEDSDEARPSDLAGYGVGAADKVSAGEHREEKLNW